MHESRVFLEFWLDLTENSNGMKQLKKIGSSIPLIMNF